MTPRVLFGPEAVAELSEAVRWYEQRRDGLGLSFLAAVEEAVDRITRWPLSGSSVPEIEGIDVRRARLHRFPYHVAYIVARANCASLRSPTTAGGVGAVTDGERALQRRVTETFRDVTLALDLLCCTSSNGCGQWPTCSIRKKGPWRPPSCASGPSTSSTEASPR